MADEKKSSSEDHPFQSFPVVDQIFKYDCFLLTKQKIKNGESLWDLTEEERKAQGLFGPWGMNFYESFLCSIPWVIVFWCVSLFFLPITLENTSERDSSILNIYNQFDAITSKLIPPFLIMMFAWVAGFASLKAEDSTPEKRKRAMNAYLYVDGSYGLLPQTLIVLGVSLLLFTNTHQLSEEVSGFLLITGGVILLVSMLWNYHVILHMIPLKLFEANGYSSTVRKSFSWFSKKAKDPNMGPWSKYTFYFYFGAGTLTWLLLVMLAYFQYNLASLIVDLRIPR